jgi:hypothetical protein
MGLLGSLSGHRHFAACTPGQERFAGDGDAQAKGQAWWAQLVAGGVVPPNYQELEEAGQSLGLSLSAQRKLRNVAKKKARTR